MGDQHERLRRARMAAGFARQADVTRRFEGWNKNTYKSNENGAAPYSFAQAKVYGEAFGVRPEWLYDGRAPMSDDGSRRTVPLVGYVGAGAEAHFYASGDQNLGEVDAPENSRPETVAVEVRGTSLGPLFERWLIYYDEVRTPVTPDLYNRLCIVGLLDGRILVKQIKQADRQHHFHLLSNNEEPLFNQEVVWAARVRSMTPR